MTAIQQSGYAQQISTSSGGITFNVTKSSGTTNALVTFTEGLRVDSLGNITTTGSNATVGFKQDFGGSLRVAGNIVATSEITAYFSDARLKANVTPIQNAINLVMAINGVYYNPNELAEKLTGEDRRTRKVGLLAQEVEQVMPYVVKSAPFDIGDHGISKSGEHYLTLQYERLVPLLVQAIKEQQKLLDQFAERLLMIEKQAYSL